MPNTSSPVGGRLRVLVVEDEALVADYVADIVEDEGHEVAGFAASGESALQHLKPGHVDLAILDIKLKGVLTGIDVAAAAREQAIPHLFISGSGDPETRRAADATDPIAFLQKPFSY